MPTEMRISSTSYDSADVELGEHIFVNDGTGRFSDETDDRWPEHPLYGYDDNNVVFLDVDSDGDADFLVGSLDGPDRILLNDGAGNFTVNEEIREGAPTTGTLWLSVADLNGDAKLDLVETQGEVDWPDFVYLGLGVAPDTAPPIVSNAANIQASIHARIDDRKSPNVASDWREVVVLRQGKSTPMQWYGEYLMAHANARTWHLQGLCNGCGGQSDLLGADRDQRLMVGKQAFAGPELNERLEVALAMLIDDL